MEQHKAVKLIMLDIKLNGRIPPEYYSEIREYLATIYVVGHDFARQELCAHNKKRIGQYDSQGKLINEFGSLKEASRKTGFKEEGLYSAVLRGSRTRQGHRWKYLPKIIKEPVHITEQALTQKLKHHEKLISF